MNHTLDVVVTALLWGAAGGALAWLVSWPLRRNQTGVLISVAAVATVSSVAAVIGNTRAMFVSMNDEWITVLVAIIAGGMAAGAGLISARRFARDSREVHDAVDALREGRVPAVDRLRPTGELQRLQSELADTARTLVQSRERQRALEASRRELVAWVSHDLRTPLAGLRAMSEALEDGVAESPERYYKQIRVEVDRLAGMVDDLFEVSRLQAGAPSARTERVHLDDLVSDSVAGLEAVANVQRVSLRGRPGPVAEVVGNSDELNRALTNLLVNAIRHTSAYGTVEITVSLQGESVEVRVRDECGGINPNDLERVFEVGFRGEAARTPQPGLGGGAGLGLAITRGIVTAHSGTIDVHNVPDGCMFTVRLPLHRGA